jgi:hypothetical protein
MANGVRDVDSLRMSFPIRDAPPTITVLVAPNAPTRSGRGGRDRQSKFYELPDNLVPATDSLRPLRLLPPRGVLAGALLEAKDGVQRMLVQIPLTDTERAAVEGDSTAIDRLLASLADTPTPTGDGPASAAIRSSEPSEEDER